MQNPVSSPRPLPLGSLSGAAPWRADLKKVTGPRCQGQIAWSRRAPVSILAGHGDFNHRPNANIPARTPNSIDVIYAANRPFGQYARLDGQLCAGQRAFSVYRVTIAQHLESVRTVSVRHCRSVPAGFRRCGDLGWRIGPVSVDIVHPFDGGSISDSAMVGSLVGLVDAGVIAGQRQFEDAAVQMIRSAASTEAGSWAAFYDNSITELRDGGSPFGPVHARARSLVVGDSLLEVGSCFGFLALQCAEDGFEVSACDISPGAVEHLRAAARRRQTPLRAVVGDATDLPFDTDAVDTVTLIHLLEHLDEQATVRALTEALRVARRRVVVAVPFEEHPSEHFGHLIQLTLDDLAAWAGQVEHDGVELFTHLGGWMVLTPVARRSV